MSKDISLLLKEKREKWHKKYPEAHQSPWDCFHPLNFDKKTPPGCPIGEAVEKTAWLNPHHQQHLSYGTFSERDFREWINGIPGKIIKSQEHWDELCYLCRTNTFGIALHLPFFNMHPIKYLLSPGQVFQPGDRSTREVGTGLPKRLQLPIDKTAPWKPRKLSPELIEAVEGHIKYLIKKDIEDQLVFRQASLFSSIALGREAEGEIYGFMFCLKSLGLETVSVGFSNTPELRENFAWWRTILREETRWEMLVEKGEGYEPWIKTKKSLYWPKSEEVQ